MFDAPSSPCFWLGCCWRAAEVGANRLRPAVARRGNSGNGDKLLHATSLGKNNAPGCTSCHATEAGKTLVGPSMAGIGTRVDQEIKLADYKGQAKTGTDYVRESIVNPNVYVVKGFSPGIMYQNYGKDLSDQEVNDIVAYLMTLK